MTISRLAATLIMLAAIASALADNGLARRIQAICDSADATIGVAVIVDGTDTTVVDGAARYPMASVVKLHQAIAVCRHLDRQGMSLDDTLPVPAAMMVQGIYSPMRDRYPDGIPGITIGELLLYSLQQSDNIACDVLFGLIGGPQAADNEIRALGLDGFAIAHTEAEMHDDPAVSADNWTYPLTAAALLEMLVTRPLCSATNQRYVIDAMTGCDTGQDRIPSPLLGTPAIVGHKTGTGDRDAHGHATAVNDAAFVILPDGRHYVLAIFITASTEDDTTNARLMADISAAVYDHVTSGSNWNSKQQ